MEFYSNLPVDATATPTLFEVVSSTEVDELLKPTFQYLSAKAITRSPSVVGIKLHSYFDELYTLLKLLLEYYHLRAHNATFIEKFYGLQRRSIRRNGAAGENANPLSSRQIATVLLDKVLLSYITDKLEYWHGILQGRRLTARLSSREQKFVDWYPYLRKVAAVVGLACKIRYLSGRSRGMSVFDTLAKVEFARYEPLATSSQYTRSDSVTRPVHMNLPWLALSIQQRARELGTTVGMFASGLFPTFIFTIRLLQQWAQQPSHKQELLNGEEEVPPPPRLDSLYPGRSTKRDCPICSQKIVNPGVLQTGFVACYPCAVHYVTEQGLCPVTGTPLLGGSRGVRKLLC